MDEVEFVFAQEVAIEVDRRAFETVAEFMDHVGNAEGFAQRDGRAAGFDNREQVYAGLMQGADHAEFYAVVAESG